MKNNENEKLSSYNKIVVTFLILALVISIFNQFQLMSMRSGKDNIIPTGVAFAEASIVPTGTPKIYGKELGVSYDDVSPNNPELADQTIEVLANLDKTITLTGADLDRYIDITSEMSCEYCCGASSIIVRREDVDAMDKKIEAAIASGAVSKEQAEKYRQTAGDPACGCAHSYAMRGLAKYLITEHNDEFSDKEILEELAKWKTLFFPGQLTSKAAVLKEKNIEFSYINLASNRYRGIEQGATAGSGMVGGC